jgi:MraZ protein
MAKIFSGFVEITADEKNRYRFPAKFKDAYIVDEELTEVYMFKDLQQNCITIYPKAEGDKILAKLKTQLGILNNSLTPVIEYFATNMDLSKVDSQGRFTLSSEQLNGLKLGKEVVMTGMINKLQLWSKEEYQKHQAEQAAVIVSPEVAESINNLFVGI